MARYSNEFKARAVARLLPPEGAPIPRISQEIGVSVATLERWMSDSLSRPAERAWTGAPGRRHRQEVKVQTRGPDAGNPTPKRQGRRSGAPGCRLPGGTRSREGRFDGVI